MLYKPYEPFPVFGLLLLILFRIGFRGSFLQDSIPLPPVLKAKDNCQSPVLMKLKSQQSNIQLLEQKVVFDPFLF